MSEEIAPKQHQFFEYLNDEGLPVAKVDYYDGDMWITQAEMAKLFEVEVATVNHHIKSIYETGELKEAPTIRNVLTVRMEGGREVKRNINSYSLDMIIAVGYRVGTAVGTRFRIWATDHLTELVKQGYTLDEKRLSAPKDKSLDDLLDRIRAIRSSEKYLAEKVKDIFTTSIDYEPSSEMANNFFKTVNNKFHYAVHGHTAPEIIKERINPNHETLGLITHRGGKPTKKDAGTAKNYLDGIELRRLELLVDGFLTYAAFQANEGRAMRMADWRDQLDKYLRFHDLQILEGYGTVTRDEVDKLVAQKYMEYNNKMLGEKAPKDQIIDSTGKRYIKKIEYGND